MSGPEDGLYFTRKLLYVPLRTVSMDLHPDTVSHVDGIQAVLSVAFFIPGFISVFLSNPIKEFVIFIDLVFSYLCEIQTQSSLWHLSFVADNRS